MHKTFTISTKENKELIDITDRIEELIKGTKNETITVFAKHTTCAVVITETGENLGEDIIGSLSSIGQLMQSRGFNHSHGDPSHTPSHIFSALFGQSRTIPVSNGKLNLGTWQRICLLELNGPRKREIVVAL